MGSLAIARGACSFTLLTSLLTALFTAVVGGGVTGGTLAACSRDAAPPPPVASPVVVGATAPLTGAQQSLGPSVQQMLQLAESQVNARGGALGRSLHLDIRDDGSDPAVTTTPAQDLVSPANG